MVRRPSSSGALRVLLLSRYGRKGPSSRMRHDQFLPRLAADGIEVEVAPFFPDAYLDALFAGRRWPLAKVAGRYATRIATLLGAGRHDLLWIEKETLPWLPYGVERLLLAAAPPYVVDFDDAWFHHYDLHRRPLVRRLLGSKLDRLMRGAALVTAGNGYLAERAGRAGARRVEILPTVVDLDRYPAVRSGAAPQRNGPLRVGWIGSPVTAPYLDLLAEPLARLGAEGLVRPVLIGAGGDALPGLDAERIPWSEAGEVAALEGLDAGVMPLLDSPWERGKCGYKLIQYMACAKPAIASPVGVNPTIVEDGVTGLLADGPAGWETALRRLAVDPALRHRMGAAGRAKIERAYSLQAVAPRLAGLLRSVVPGTVRDAEDGAGS
ncbi:glycosyltransferase family 4 protein [Azospirillum agricola]|uniref:glycosyltransferase family 4 protein n=1 Tax=Azospirillum agricola TaxID=1720247 RepID=UPI000A0F24C3|nr:glycosyltransferase family 4 protein [Azospirillum agricola]SMH41209.1 Glycosyltransferase involved in cell wall bisynthesis [Azospirillum lipoferum]